MVKPSSITKIYDKLEKIDSHIMEIKIEIATLKVKAGIWGVMGGMTPAILALIYIYLKN